MLVTSAAQSRPPIIGLVDIREPVDDAGLDRVVELLPAARRARLRRFVRRDDRTRGALADLLAAALLARVLDRPVDELGIGRDARGAPFPVCTGPAPLEPISVSLTHSGGWVGCAVARGPVGIDIERHRPVTTAAGFAMFDHRTATRLAAVADPHRSRLAVGWWCAVESFLKMLGTGLAVDPRAVHAVQVADRLLALRSPTGDRAWALLEPLDADHALGVCTTAPPAAPPIRIRMSAADLITARLSSTRRRTESDSTPLGVSA